jgi:photosystem II reaction center protein PsbP
MLSKWMLIFPSIILVTITQIALLQSNATPQTGNYDDYESYTNSRLNIKLEYPSDWEIVELDASSLSNLKGVVSFEPQNSKQESQAGIAEVETPIISITAEELTFTNMTIDEFSRLQTDNIQYLFSDLDFKLENKTATTVGNNTAIEFVYTIIDPYAPDNLRIRYGTDIWTIRADTIYTISFLGQQDQYFKYLPSVQKIIDSLEFIG